MKLPLKALAALAVALATTVSMAEDQPSTTAQAKREVTREDHAIAKDAPHSGHRIARYPTTARPPINGAVLADGVTIDGGQ